MDTIAGLILLGIISALLIGTVGKYNAATARLGEARSAARTAETVLASLQAGRVDLPPDARVAVEPIAGAADAPAGWIWVQVQVDRPDRPSTLRGIIPAGLRDQLPQGGTTGGGEQ